MTFSVATEHGDALESATDQDAEREARLVAWFRDSRSTLIGFSGGVDSAYLACVALDALGPAGVLAVIGRSASYPAEQWERARAVAERFGVPVLEVATDELNDQRYSSNPANRRGATTSAGRWCRSGSRRRACGFRAGRPGS